MINVNHAEVLAGKKGPRALEYYERYLLSCTSRGWHECWAND